MPKLRIVPNYNGREKREIMDKILTMLAKQDYKGCKYLICFKNQGGKELYGWGLTVACWNSLDHGSGFSLTAIGTMGAECLVFFDSSDVLTVEVTRQKDE